MNLRHVLEAGAWAAYAIANPADDNFIDRNQDGMLRITDKLAKRRNAWLDTNFSDASEYIKTQKSRMNNTIAHAGLVYTETVFNIDRKRDRLTCRSSTRKTSFTSNQISGSPQLSG